MDFRRLKKLLSSTLSGVGATFRDDGVEFVVAMPEGEVFLKESFPGACTYRSASAAPLRLVLRAVRAAGWAAYAQSNFKFADYGDMGWYAHVRITTACNFRCGFCHVDLEGAVIPIKEVMAALRAASAGFGRPLSQAFINISGGEPTLHPGFPGLLAELADAGCTGRVETNASRFGSPETVRGLFSGGRGRFAALVSFHSHIPSTFAKVCQVPEGEFQVVVAGLRNLLGTADFRVTVNRLFCAENVGELPGYAEFLGREIVPFATSGFGLNTTVVGKIPSRCENSLVRHSDSVRELEAALPRLRQLPIVLNVARRFGSGCGVPYCLTADLGPEFLPPPLTAANAAVNRHPACAGCPALPVCPGVTDAYAQHFGTDEMSAARFPSYRAAPVPAVGLPGL